mgnify:CR=1|jgi:tRNA nucleotidyltransferase/poly(A) polymerase
MKTFHQYFKESTMPGWDKLLQTDPYFKAAVDLLGEIEQLGGDALIVGGAVRDLLLGKPTHDIDIATNVPLEQISAKFKTHDIGQSKDFGIVTVSYGGHQFEVAQFREDVYGD